MRFAARRRYQAYKFLEEHPGSYVTELAIELDIHLAEAAELIEELESRGYVEMQHKESK